MADISVAQFLLRGQNHVALADVSPRVPLWRPLAVYAVPALLAGALISASAVWFAMRPAPSQTARLMIPGSTTAPLTVGIPRPIAITRDGTRIVYVGVGGTLFVRSLDQLEPTP